MMPTNIFITGVTGYIGGDFLYNVSHRHPGWHITALVRSQDKAKKVQINYPKAKLVIGDNNSKDLIEREAANADIVFHFADSADDEPSARAISAGLAKSGGIWIHTSGTMLLVRPNLSFDSYGKDDGESYDDWDGVSRLVSMPNDAPHRDIDKIVLATGSETIRTAIVCPPTIYGPGRGPDRTISMQAYQAAVTTLKNKRGFIYGEGKNIWHQVHVQDLTDLYLLLGEAALERDSSATWNQSGYYLAENGAFEWGQILKGIARYAYEKGFIPTDELECVDASQAKGRYSLSVGTTSKGVSYRAKKLLGWKPYRRSLIDEVPDIVDGEAAKLCLTNAY